MSTIETHADWVLDRLAALAVPVFDGKVGQLASGALGSAVPAGYVLVRTNRQLPDGQTVPDRVKLNGLSVAVDVQVSVYAVGATAAQARAIAGQAEALLLDVVPVIANRVCFPIRWVDGNPASVDEQTLIASHEQVDVYRMSTQAA